MSKNYSPFIFNGDFAKSLKSKLNLADDVFVLSEDVDPTAVATDAPIGSILINQTTGFLYKKLDAGSSTNWKRDVQLALEYMGSITHDPTGFPNRTDTVIAFVDVDRKITVAPTDASFTVYSQGAVLTLGSINTTWTDTEGLWYAYIDSSGTLVATQSFDLDTLIMSNVLVAVWYWDATNKASIYRGDERHGISMDGATHSYLHSTFGTRFVSGLALNTFTFTSGPNVAPVSVAEAEIGSDAGVIADEDIRHSLSAILSTASKVTFYRLGASGVWRRQVDGSIPTIYDGSTRIQYNEFTGATWQLTTVPNNNDFMLLHAFATNDAAQPVVYICGQQTYTSTSDARIGATEELNSLLIGGLPFAEFKAIGTVIYQTNSGWNAGFKKCKVIKAISGGADYVDWRTSQVEGNLAGVTDHGTLSGLSDDDHLQYHNDTRGDALYYRKTEFKNASAGAGDAGKPVVLDAAGHIDATMVNDADIDHGSVGGLADDDHTQYHNDTRGDARYFKSSTPSAIDHGSISGLSDDDHTQYSKADGTRAITGQQTFSAGAKFNSAVTPFEFNQGGIINPTATGYSAMRPDDYGQFNAVGYDGTNYRKEVIAQSGHFARARGLSGSTTADGSTWNTVVFGTEDFDEASAYDHTTGIYTIPANKDDSRGYYRVTCFLSVDFSGGSGFWKAAVWTNASGSDIEYLRTYQNINEDYTSVVLSCVIKVDNISADRTIKIRTQFETGQVATYVNEGVTCNLTIEKIRGIKD